MNTEIEVGMLVRRILDTGDSGGPPMQVVSIAVNLAGVKVAVVVPQRYDRNGPAEWVSGGGSLSVPKTEEFPLASLRKLPKRYEVTFGHVDKDASRPSEAPFYTEYEGGAREKYETLLAERIDRMESGEFISLVELDPNGVAPGYGIRVLKRFCAQSPGSLTERFNDLCMIVAKLQAELKAVR